MSPAPPAHLEDGLHLVASAVRRDPGNPIVALKTTSRADYVYARLEARRAGADDALFLTVSGHLSESTTANVFLVRNGADGTPELATPSLECAILPGTTRSWLLAWAGRVGLRAVEGWLTPDQLAAADEAFVCSSVAGVLPVTRFNGHPIGTGGPARGRGARGPTARGSSSGADSPAATSRAPCRRTARSAPSCPPHRWRRPPTSLSGLSTRRANGRPGPLRPASSRRQG